MENEQTWPTEEEMAGIEGEISFILYFLIFK